MKIRKAAVCGNSSFPLDASVGSQVVDILRGLGPNVVVLTRARPTFDKFVQTVCLVLGIRCLTFDAAGGPTNIERDSSMISACTELHAFLNLDEFEQGASSGTFWLVEKSLAAGKPTYAYTAVDGALVHVGSQEGA